MKLVAKLALRLPSSPSAAASARHAVRALSPRVSAAVIEDLELLVTEVITNAVVHGPAVRPDSIGLDIFEFDDIVRVEVRDPGPGFTPSAREPPSPDSERGRGLYLVDVVADRWGVTGDDSTLVWFELAISSNGAGSDGASPNQNGKSPAEHVATSAEEMMSDFRRRAEQRGLEVW